MPRKTTRRDFIKTSASIGAAVYVGGSIARGQDSPNEKVRYACIGLGGKGTSDSADAAQHGVITAVCDIDERTMARATSRPQFKDAEKFFDFREMLDQAGDKIDAVVISTPDHTHAPAAAMAMNMGKHCFCQKPMTHTVWEARRLQEIAKEKGVKTIMGNQGTAENGLRHAAALLKQGAIGKVKEVHVVTNRPIWLQGNRPRPASEPVPPHVHWDLWLGPAPERDYGEGYHDFAWRGWWDFGTGALGDMACHTFNMPFAGLNLANPNSIQAWSSGHNRDSYPNQSEITFEFPHPEGEGLLPVKWYDGGRTPDESLLNGYPLQKDREGRARGAIIVGEDLVLYSPQDYGANFMLIDKDGKVVDTPDAEYERSPGHFTEFHQAIIGERDQAMSNFPEYAGPLTETILLGNLAVYVAEEGTGPKLEWDSEKLKATNAPETDKVVKKDYRGNYGEYLGA